VTGQVYDSFKSLAEINGDHKMIYYLSLECGAYKSTDKKLSVRYALTVLNGTKAILKGRYQYYNDGSKYYSTGGFFLKEFSIGAKIFLIIS
jgi:hypothetical protein